MENYDGRVIIVTNLQLTHVADGLTVDVIFCFPPP